MIHFAVHREPRKPRRGAMPCRRVVLVRRARDAHYRPPIKRFHNDAGANPETRARLLAEGLDNALAARIRVTDGTERAVLAWSTGIGQFETDPTILARVERARELRRREGRR